MQKLRQFFGCKFPSDVTSWTIQFRNFNRTVRTQRKDGIVRFPWRRETVPLIEKIQSHFRFTAVGNPVFHDPEQIKPAQDTRRKHMQPFRVTTSFQSAVRHYHASEVSLERMMSLVFLQSAAVRIGD